MNTIGDAIEKWKYKKWDKKQKEGIYCEGYPNLKFEKEMKEKLIRGIDDLQNEYINKIKETKKLNHEELKLLKEIYYKKNVYINNDYKFSNENLYKLIIRDILLDCNLIADTNKNNIYNITELGTQFLKYNRKDED